MNLFFCLIHIFPFYIICNAYTKYFHYYYLISYVHKINQFHLLSLRPVTWLTSALSSISDSLLFAFCFWSESMFSSSLACSPLIKLKEAWHKVYTLINSEKRPTYFSDYLNTCSHQLNNILLYSPEKSNELDRQT